MAEEGVAGQLANLHLDEPTGEMIRYLPIADPIAGF